MEKIITKEELMPLVYSAAALFIVGVLGALFTQTTSKTMFSIVFALFFYFILPGYCVLLNFKNMDSLERIILGAVVSSAVIPLILYAVNIFGISISRLNTFIAILLVVVVSLAIKRTKTLNTK